jgi:geranyl-CoA carboxylase beta subunit
MSSSKLNMPVFRSQIDASSPGFSANRADMLVLLQRIRQLEQRVRDLSEKRRQQFEQRGQLMPRDRIALLLDSGSPFLELSSLAGLGMHEDDGKDFVMGGNIVSGIGYVGGRCCMIICHDSAIKGGTMLPIGVKKHLRAQQIARENKLPTLYLVESGGGNLNYQGEMFIDGGRQFANQARLSAAGIPQISVVHGSSTAGGAYIPGLSDYVIMVRGRAKVFLAGPPLLKAATGEIATDEELGGAELHSVVSGVSDYMVNDDRAAIECARRIVASLNWAPDSTSPSDFRMPRYSPDELAGVVPVDFRKSYDVHEVIARLVDDSEFFDFKSNYGPATVCGEALIEGQALAIIGNNGPIDADGSAKAAQFIQLMCQSGRPIVYLQNITGYMVGTDAERRGIVKHGSKMIQAVANATVPQITIHIGASFGAGNYGMCGRSFDPRFLFSWPNSRVAVMGGEQAARVMTIVAEEGANKRGKPIDREALQQAERRLIELFERESTALHVTARVWDDGIIDPRDTRKVLALCLRICRDADGRRLNTNTFGVARF